MSFNDFKERSFLGFVIFYLMGCSPKLMIVTEPSDVEVALRLSSGTKKSLGKTPLEVNLNDLEKDQPLSVSTGEMYNIELDKEGFENQQIWAPAGRFGLTRVTLFSKMSSGSRSARSADLLLQSLHNAQKFAGSGNFESALKEVDKVIEENPNFIRALSMKGAILYSQQRLDDSLVMYEKALTLDKQFDEAIRMIDLIKKKKGVIPR